jgi:LPXTG-motif cell wall-anchored protein
MSSISAGRAEGVEKDGVGRATHAARPDEASPTHTKEWWATMSIARGAKAVTAASVLSLLFAASVMTAPGAGAQNHDPGPPGNNGTVKLDGLDLDDGPGHTNGPNDPGEMEPDNDPHLTCGLQLEFFNFDAGQLADIVFTAKAPTGTNGVLLEQQDVEISDDGTGGANNDPDAVLDYDVLTDFDTTQFTDAHDVHGWHVNLDLTLYNADGTPVPGGQKHKTFWVEGCQPEPAVVCPPNTTAPAGPMVDADNDGVAENCVAPVVVVCPPNTTAPAGPMVDADNDGVAENCVAPVVVVCPPNTTAPAGPMVDADNDGVAENCVAPTVVIVNPTVVECPEGTMPPAGETAADLDGDGDADNCARVLPAGPVTRPTAPEQPGGVLPAVQPQAKPVPAAVVAPAAAPQVLGDVVTRSAALPRTGSNGTVPLTALGLGLVLAGVAFRRTGTRYATVR